MFVGRIAKRGLRTIAIFSKLDIWISVIRYELAAYLFIVHDLLDQGLQNVNIRIERINIVCTPERIRSTTVCVSFETRSGGQTITTGTFYTLTEWFYFCFTEIIWNKLELSNEPRYLDDNHSTNFSWNLPLFQDQNRVPRDLCTNTK